MDLTVIAIPGYFGTMGAEYLWLKHHREERGPTAGDYEWRDTLTSLLMGQISLVAPMVMGRVLAPVTPGKGRYTKALVGVAVGAAVTVTVADVVAKRLEGELPEAGTLPDPDPGSAPASALEADAVGPAARAVAAADDPSGNRSRRRRLARVARKVGGSGAVTAIAAAGVAAATTWASRTTARRLFDRTPGRDLGTGPIALAGIVVAWDFLYYWNHRLAHESRYLWAAHVVHHSSEHYNLSTALRQAVTDQVTMSIPYNALALVGFRPSVIETGRGINLLYQYWVHTEAIGRLPRFERVFNSPSAHRVHHGSNRRYLDRNHGGIFIVWDRLFGTFQEEDEPVVYGLTRNINTFNPLVVATHEWRDMGRDVAGARTWAERLGYVFRGPGWAYERRRIAEAEAEAGTEAVSGRRGAPALAASVA